MNSATEERDPDPEFGERLEFRILGTPEVWQGKTQLAVTAVKQLAVLAMGLLRANQVVSTERLIDAVWGDDPPRTASALIQTYVSVLRRILGGDADGRLAIVTRPPGYLVRVQPEQLDLQRFEALAASARSAADCGDDERAAAQFAAALAIWRGPALQGLTTPVLVNEARRLDEQRQSVIEERIGADLRCGRAGIVTPELSAMVAAHPLRERLRAYHMLALYHLGRQAEALESFREAHRTLRTELGVEPGPELRDLHQAMLRGDSSLHPPRPEKLAVQRKAPTPSSTTTAVVPGQLPPAVDLTGRDRELAALEATLSESARGEHPLCVEIAGRAGSGKTALAVAAAQRARADFPDGQFYAVLQDRGDGTARTVEVLGAFLRALGVDAARLPATVGESSGLFRSILAGRRVLVLLDDAMSEEQVRPLMPTSPGTATLITSRRMLPGLEATTRVHLDVLEPDAAKALLGKLVGPVRIEADPEAAHQIVELCDRLPLAVRTAGARLAGRQHWPLTVLASRLRDERRRLDELSAGDLAVRTSLALTYSGLADPLRLALRRLGALGAPELDPRTLAGLLDVPADKAEYLAERLTDAQLLDAYGIGSDGQPRYRMHDLIRLYARERADLEDPPAEQAGAVANLIRRLLADNGEGSLDVEADRTALVVVVERASELGQVELACDLSEAMLSSFRLRNRFDEWWRTHDAALRAARAAGSGRSEARLILGLGQLRYEQDRLVEAAELYLRALSIFDGAGDDGHLADALIGLAAARREHGELREALTDLHRARELSADLADPVRMGHSAYGIGYVLRETGDFEGSHAALAESLAAYRECGDRRGEGLTLRSIALTYRAAGDLTAAARLAAESIDILAGLHEELLVAYARQTLAKVHLRQGLFASASAALETALSTCERFQDEFGTALILRTLGELHLAREDLSRAGALLNEARARFEALDLPLFRARAERDLAGMHERRGDAETAGRLRDSALSTFAALGSREYEELKRDWSAGQGWVERG